ncbi:coiled-coil domain-containing protein 40-like [Daphnia pulex]|uniref:coiled-coil domain-containing protein 40-like n=1 Tax=Daphnia pulex TaxID=6669 RepID=UPI001EDEF093|nr:coiled-coil domain-containing protein 40-like [Daphnia pulex]
MFGGYIHSYVSGQPSFPWRPVNNKSLGPEGRRSVYGHLQLGTELARSPAGRRNFSDGRMRDLIVKINTDPAVGASGGGGGGLAAANQQTTNRRNRSPMVDNGAIRAGTGDGLSLTVRSLREDDGLSTDDGSDSGTAGTPTSQTAGYWPDLEVLDPDHPILERFQANLTQLLDEEDQQLTLKILEAEEKRKCVLRERKKISAGLDEMKRLNERSRVTLRKEKEALDVEKAKRLQVEGDVLPEKKQQFESLERLLGDVESADGLLEKDLESGRKKLATIRQRLEEQQQQLAQARGQLDQGHRQRDSNQAHKLLQDVVINQLLSDVEAAEWKRNQMENVLLDEEQLTAGLRDAIRGAHAQVAAINTEKIRLNQSWQSSLLALQKNNEALAAVHQSIRNEEARRDEINRCWAIGEKETTELASKRTNVQFELGRLERKITNLETQCQTREAQKSSDDQRNRHLESIIRSREEELQTLIREAELLAKSESDALDRLQAQRCKNKTLEAAILDQVYRSVACDQEAQAIYRHIRQMEEASTELDFEIAKAESRNGRALLERDDLEKELQEKTKELEEKQGQVAARDGQIKRLEAELSEQQKLLERKEMHWAKQKVTLDELRATLEENQARTEEERVVRALQEQLDQVRQTTDSLQRQWSEAEQQLLQVAMTRDIQAVEEEKLREEIAVWDEKKKRLLREVAGLKQTQLQCKRSIHGWREYLQQLDARLAQQSANKESLERHNQHFQHQWQLHLEEPERKVHRVREEILQLRAQKSNLEISLCDLNKVIVLWTGKLADIREAQSYYQAERSDAGSLALLQAEKHRLQVQEVQLRKDQELLNHQLQKAVLGRSVLNTKADIRTGVGHKTRIVKEPVDSNAWHKILSKEIAKRRKEVLKLKQSITERKAVNAELTAQRDSLRDSLEMDRNRLEQLDHDIAEAVVTKRRAISTLVGHQKWWRFYDQLKYGTYRRKHGADSLAEAESRARQKLIQLTKVADKLACEYPHLEAQLNEIRDSLN